jgi:hypothetical protein
MPLAPAAVHARRRHQVEVARQQAAEAEGRAAAADNAAAELLGRCNALEAELQRWGLLQCSCARWRWPVAAMSPLHCCLRVRAQLQPAASGPFCRQQDRAAQAEQQAQAQQAAARQAQWEAGSAAAERQQALQQQLQQLSTELAASRAAAGAAEQQAASLEAALQHSNNLSASMGAKLAESLSEASNKVGGGGRQRWA